MDKSSLSRDVDFIKEFEQLKIKQKLLIESLSKKNKDELTNFLFEINSKLDFLVKIFKEANDENSHKDETEGNSIEDKVSSLEEKLTSIDTALNEKMDLLLEKVTSLKTMSHTSTITPQPISMPSTKAPSPAPIPEQSSKLPPPPSFKVEDKINNLSDSSSNPNSQADKKEEKKGFLGFGKKQSDEKKKWL